MIMPVDVAAQLHGTIPTRQPTLLYLVTEDWAFCSHRLPMARAARDAGFRVVVAARVVEHRARIEAEAFQLIDLGWKRGRSGPIAHIRALQKIVRLYRSMKPDLVHHVALKPVLFGSMAAFMVQQPAQINAITGLGYVFIGSTLKARLLGPMVRMLLRWLLDRRGSRVVVQNDADFETLAERVGISLRRLVLIPDLVSILPNTQHCLSPSRKHRLLPRWSRAC